MQKMTQWISVATVATFAMFISDAAMAAAPGEAQGYIGIGAGLAIGFAVLGGAIGQGLAARAVLESNRLAVGFLRTLCFYQGLE